LVRNSLAAPNKSADFAFREDEFVVGAGEPIDFQVESGLDPRKIDHVWVTIRAGRFGPVRISINTYSLKHAADGFDPRMRVGALISNWSHLPESGIFPTAGLDYAELERAQVIEYQDMERTALETMLKARVDRALFVEAWGVLYLRDRLGIHQVHSRRASCSVRTDYVGRDGAVRFYYRENAAAEMLLFKYCGQV
jgi:hypothetical protein